MTIQPMPTTLSLVQLTAYTAQIHEAIDADADLAPDVRKTLHGVLNYYTHLAKQSTTSTFSIMPSEGPSG